MNPDLYIVRKVNEATSVSRKVSLRTLGFCDLRTSPLVCTRGRTEGAQALLRAVLCGGRGRLSPFLCHRQGVETEKAFCMRLAHLEFHWA